MLLKEKRKARKETGNFLIEGQKEIAFAFKGDYEIEKILFCPAMCPEYEVKKWAVNVELIQITKEIFKKLAYRDTTEGVIGIAKRKVSTLSSLKLSAKPLILIVETPEKPGNIGALLRTADAAKLDAVIIANPKTDLYNPNVVRSSVGCLFTNQIAIGTTTEIIRFLRERNIAIYCATLQDTNLYHIQDYNQPTAFVVGSEDIGLSQEWRDSATKNIIIPMEGKIDSMNLSVSAAILIFEAKRQRAC